MEEKAKLRIPFIMLLLISLAILSWYPTQLLQAIFGFNFSQGTFVGSSGQSQIFSFTVADAALSMVLITLWIFRQEERKGRYLPLAIVVAYICTIPVTMWYEQVYAALSDLSNHSSYWLNLYSQPDKLTEVIIDMGLLFVAYPLMKRQNLKLVSIFALLTLVFFAGWYAIGFEFPTTSAVAYFFNAASRITSQIAVALTVLPAKSGSVRHNHWRLLALPRV